MPQPQARPGRPPRLHAVAVVLGTLLLAQPAAAEDVEDMIRFIDLMNGFFGVMGSLYDAASNPEHAALLQMNALEDIYKEAGRPAEMVAVYRGVIADSENVVVRRLARMRLADLLKEAGETAAATDVLKAAIEESVAQANERGR